MSNIKIPSYPSLQFKGNIAYPDGKPVKISKEEFVPSNKIIMIVENLNKEKFIVRSCPIRVDNINYISALPNPIHLFLSLAIEQKQKCDSIKKINFKKCGDLNYSANNALLYFDEGYTHDCYSDYIKNHISCIIILVSAIEAFLNFIIPKDFIFTTTRDGKPKKFNVKKIENSNVGFNEKIEKLIPQILDNQIFWNDKTSTLATISELYSHRKNTIHLKTNNEDDITKYFETISSAINFDLNNAIKETIFLMNSVKNNFIEFE